MKGRSRFSRAGLCALFLLLLAPLPASAVRYVSLTGSNTPPYDTWATAATNIQTAIDAASAGENIFVTNGTYGITNQISVNRGMYIRSVNGPGVTIVNGGGAYRCFSLYSVGTTLFLQGFSLVNGWENNQGSGVFVQQNVIVQDCIIRGNTNGGAGGGVFIASSGVVRRCVIEGNRSTSGNGAGVFANGGGLIQNCTIRGNTANNDGGGVYLGSGADLRSCAIVSNVAQFGYGGGVWCDNGRVENCTIVGNSAQAGGGVHAGLAGAVFRNSILVENEAGVGTNWYDPSSATFDHCATVPARGTACVTDDPRLWCWPSGDFRLYKDSPCIDAGTNQSWMTGASDVLGHPRVCNNTADIGADEFSAAFVSRTGGNVAPYDTWANAATNVASAVGVASNGYAVMLTNGVFALTNNISVTSGILVASVNGAEFSSIDGRITHRGLAISAGAVVDGITFTGCQAVAGGSDFGGGVYCSNGIVRNCVLRNGLAMSSGGGVYIDRTGVVENCVIENNAGVLFGGGGIYLNRGGFVVACRIATNDGNNGGGIICDNGGIVRSCVVVGNGTGNQGGGAWLISGGLLDNCTIYNNYATRGGGVKCDGGGQVRNSIIWSNAATLDPNNYNASGGSWTNCCTTPAIGANCLTNHPLFRNAAAQNFHLATNSPCLNSGTNQSWMSAGTDFDGYPRIQETFVDRGAFERSPVHYVYPSGAHVWPFVSWLDGATNIQAAVDVAEAADEVQVWTGIYRSAASVVVTQTIQVTGWGAVVDGDGAHRGFTVLTNAVIEGFTVTNGLSADNAGGVYGRGGAVIRSCTIRNCIASNYGGGVFLSVSGVVANCNILRNTALNNDGGGVYLELGGAVIDCTVYSNSAVQAGGVYAYNGGAIRNSLITGNRARTGDGGGVLAYLSGGMVEGCTVAGNSAGNGGGGVYCNSGGTISNSIVYGNTAGTSSNWTGGTWAYSCAAPAPGGTGNAGGNPLFADPAAGNFRVNSNSPCYNTGSNAWWMAGGEDLDGFSRVINGIVDMGCYEVTPVHYVSKSGTATWPYDAWTNSAANLQAAVNVAQPGDTIWVSNGTYTVGSFVWASQRVAIVSVNGRDATAISGGGSTRCLYMPNGGLLNGFTLTNANWAGDGAGVYGGGGLVIQSCRVVNCVAAWSGGGIYLNSSGIVENCDIRQNRASQMGGGAMLYLGGLLRNSTIYSNGSAWGGGVLCGNGASIRSCLIEGNSATSSSGGGVYIDTSGWVDNNTLVRNKAAASGGGMYCLGGGTIQNCVIVSNAAPSGPNWATNGGGAFTYSCAVPLVGGTGNIAVNPEFVSYTGGNYRILFPSPCWETGAGLGWMPGEEDLAGLPRLCGLLPDMGAYEVPVRLVSKTGSSTPPFLTWPTAATNIQRAADEADYGEAVFVTNGSYSAASDVVVTQFVLVRGVNGAGATFVNGGNAHRGFTILTNAILEGFCVTNGYSTGNAGGVYGSGGGVIQDCVVTRCAASNFGGGMFLSGTALVQRCTMAGNTALRFDGGGVYFENGGLLLNCLVVSNAARKGGGAFGYQKIGARNCVFAWNAATNAPAGETDRGDGGGILGYLATGVVENCTITRNTAYRNGGGVYINGRSILRNTIVYENASLGASSTNYQVTGGGAFTNCCTAPALGTACVAADPLFVNAAVGNFRLAWGSPCIDAGIDESWMYSGTDCDNDLRIWNNEVDIGAYELPIIHVATDGDSVPPYTTWGDAATNPVDAASVKRAHCAIWVADGTYPISAQISLTGRVTFVSVNGAANTTIRGNGATRCFDIGYGSCVIDGLTIEGGVAHAGNGGAVYITRGGSVQNCIIRSNRASLGGAIFCFASGVVDRCTLVANTATNSGAGAVYLLAGGLVKNCLVYSNTAVSAAGIYLGYGTGMVQNCTVVRNIASDQGGGIYCGPESRVENTIAWFNIGSPGSNHYESGLDIAYTNCCTAPAIGTACVDSDPRFANLGACDFHIGTNSPCVDTGIDAMGVTNDFDGMMRPLDGNRDAAAKWDIGAYEAMNILADTDDNGMPDGWEYEYYGWPVSGANPSGHDDADTVNNLDESIADTDPRDSTSFLSFTNIFCDGEWRTLQFRSSANRLYTLQCSTNPAIASSWTNGGYVDQRGNGNSRSWKETNAPVVADRILVELP